MGEGRKITKATILFMGKYPAKHFDILESCERVIISKPVKHIIDTSVTFGGRLPRRALH